jgi:hypothetical protein
MKRIEVTPGQMEQIIRLRERSISWVKIEDETTVPRRVAQRAYDEWRRQQLSKQLKEVRQSLAEEDMREHRRLLLEIASQLVSLIEIPKEENPEKKLFKVNAKNQLEALWINDRWVEKPEGIKVYVSASEELIERQIQRRNEMLFDSLKEHTKGRVRWRAKNEWEVAWDELKNDFEELETEIYRAVRETSVEIEEIKVFIEKSGPEKIYSFLDAWIRKSLISDKQVQQSIKQLTDLITGSKSRKALAGIFNKIAEDSIYGDTAGRIKSNLVRARKASRELEESLDPLVLGPLILATRCQLCPV